MIAALIGLVVVVAASVAVAFVGGLLSAAYDVRQERRAGVPVTRPAWERRTHRRASGGYRATLRGLVRGARS